MQQEIYKKDFFRDERLPGTHKEWLRLRYYGTEPSTHLIKGVGMDRPGEALSSELD